MRDAKVTAALRRRIILRRAVPRVQGISTSLDFAVATTDLMKRLRTVIVFLLPSVALPTVFVVLKTG